MKRHRLLSFITSLAMMVTIIMTLPAISVSASVNDIFEVDGLKYQVLTEDTPNTVAVIKDSLYEATLTDTVTIPVTVTNNGKIYTVTTIGSLAFYGCSSITSINIPDSVISITGNVFIGCSSLTSIMVGVNNANYSSEGGILYNKDKSELIAYPAATGSIKIIDSVTSIGENAFSSCTSLTSVTMPNVTSIGSFAFYYCSMLSNVYFFGTIPTTIGSNVFSGCTNVKCTVPSGSDTGAWALKFGNPTNVTFVTAPLITTTTLADGTVGTEYTSTLTATDTTPITWSVSEGILPAGLTLNETTGVISGTPTTAGSSTFTVKAANAYTSTTKDYTITITATTAPITITTPQSSFTNGTTGTSYSVQLQGSENGLTYSLESGSLPDGLTLTSTGLISGTPTASGTFTFTVKAANVYTSTTKDYTITIASAPTVQEPAVDNWYSSRRSRSLPIGGYITYDDNKNLEDIAAGAGVSLEETIIL